jgi:hypothetical protein
MNQAQEYPSYSGHEAHLARFELKPTISSYAYAQEVEHCKRATKRLAAIAAKTPRRDPHLAALKLGSAILEIQGESK